MAIPVHDYQLHHERDNTREYSETDHRVDYRVCAHTRFFDTDETLQFGYCLDCGATIKLGTYQVVEDQPHLIDSVLASERVRYNLLWRGFDVVGIKDAPPDMVE